MSTSLLDAAALFWNMKLRESGDLLSSTDADTVPHASLLAASDVLRALVSEREPDAGNVMCVRVVTLSLSYRMRL